LKHFMGKTALLLAMATASASPCLAQADSRNVAGAAPPPELARFEPFLGRYSAAVDWPTRNLKWEGTLELTSEIKGWYIESNLIKETAGPHRQWRLLIAWDGREKKYRVWRFETHTPFPSPEGVVKFDGDNEWHAEWQLPQVSGKTVTHFSRFRLKSRDELDIVTDTLDAEGKRENLGVVTCKRRK